MCECGSEPVGFGMCEFGSEPVGFGFRCMFIDEATSIWRINLAVLQGWSTLGHVLAEKTDGAPMSTA